VVVERAATIDRGASGKAPLIATASAVGSGDRP
jgi:hypothetical protein